MKPNQNEVESLMNIDSQRQKNPYAHDQDELFDRFVELSNRLHPQPLRQAGRAEVLGWDIEYVSGPAVVANVQYQILRRINDFFADNESPHILDIGANIGLSVLHYKRLYPGARIIAFEPDPEFLPLLRRNLERNGASDVQIVAAAAWTADGQASWISEGVDGSKIVTEDDTDNRIVNVETVDLARYLDNPIDLIKMDIEGAELQVIPYSKGELDQVKQMSIECHLTTGKYGTFGRLLGILELEGFSVTLNSYSAWQDLIRVQEILPDHFQQYVAVSAARHKPACGLPDWGISPNADLSLILQMSELRRHVSKLNQQLSESRSSSGKITEHLEETNRKLSEIEQVRNQLESSLRDQEYHYHELESLHHQLEGQYQVLLNQLQESQALVKYLQQPLYRRAISKIKRKLSGQ
jgi:FkbM family methyltransferase